MTNTPEELRERFDIPAQVRLGVNDIGWLRILSQPRLGQQLESKGWFTITAAEVRELSGRPPRLMAKHDFRDSRPWIFARENLSILPLSRSTYLVGRFDVYAAFPSDTETGPVQVRELPAGIDTLADDVLSSEGLALAAAYASGMLADFLGTDAALYPTVSGRMSAGAFDLAVRDDADWHFHVDRAQMEIDAGYENTGLLAVVEAKNQLADDFNVRQLYFPYRRFKDELPKPVCPVYLVYSNGVFRLYLYRFPAADSYRGVELVRAARYALSPSRIHRDTLREILASTREEAPDRAVPFPQADSFDRVVNLCELLFIAPEPLGPDDIVNNFDFAPRQAQYYAQAAAYVGLVARCGQELVLTDAGSQIIATRDRTRRNVALLRQLAARPVLRQMVDFVAEHGTEPPIAVIAADIARAGLKLSENTRRRRARTVRSWAGWVLDLCREERAGQLSLWES